MNCGFCTFNIRNAPCTGNLIMNVETRIISCGNCGQKLRIPFDRTRLIVTCPQCRNGWEWTADEPPPATANRPRKLISISLGVLAALVLIAGVWTRSWLPTGLFALSLVVRWICRFRLAYNDPKKLWEKGA